MSEKRTSVVRVRVTDQMKQKILERGSMSDVIRQALTLFLRHRHVRKEVVRTYRDRGQMVEVWGCECGKELE